MAQPYNLSVLRRLEEYDQKTFSRLVLRQALPNHLDVVLFGCTPTVANPDGLYLHVDSLRAFCNAPTELSEVRFHLNCIDAFDRTYLLDMTAASIDAYMQLLLAYEDYQRVPDWYNAIALGLPALGLVDFAVLNRKGLLKKTALGAAALAGGALWELLANLPAGVTNAMARILRRKYERIVTRLRQREINASFLVRTLIPRKPDAEKPEYVAFRDAFTSPQDPFPKPIFKCLLLLLADAATLPAGEASRIFMPDVRFYAYALQMTRHYHPELLAISEDVLSSVRKAFRVP